MSRPPRIVAPGATYHITARGNNSEAIFGDVYDRYEYLGLLAKARRVCRVHILAYALMTNHVHLVLQTEHVSVSSVVQLVHGAYAAAFNRKRGRTGHLFGGRFYSHLVERDTHLLTLTRYVHLNPMRAGLAARPEDYPWTSYRLYVSPDINQSLIDPAPVLGILSSNREWSRLAYAQFVSQEDEGDRSIDGDPAEWIKSATRLVVGAMNLTEHEVLEHKRGAQARAAVLYLLRETKRLSYGVLGEAMNISPSAVGNAIARLRHASAMDPTLRARLHRLSEDFSQMTEPETVLER